MKKKLKIGMRSLLGAGCLGLFAPIAFSQTIFEDDFEEYFPPDSIWNWETSADGWEITDQDPDGTTNNSMFTDGGNVFIDFATHAFIEPVVPTNADPVVYEVRFWDPVETAINEETEEEELLWGQIFTTIRPAAVANFVALGLFSGTDIGEYDVTRYQARILGGGNWHQLAAERPSEPGWVDFRIVIHGASVDFYVNGQLDPNGTGLPRTSGAAVSHVYLGGGLATETSGHWDDVNIRRDSSFARDFHITSQPSAATAEFGEDATFTVEVSGDGPFEYQWQRNGEDLVDGDGISGSTTDTLTFTDLQEEDRGDIQVIVTDTSDGFVLRSVFAALRVVPSPPPATGVRFGAFEEFDDSTPNGTVMFRQPSYSGSSRGLLASPNMTQVVGDFPEGIWGARALHVNFAFDPDFTPTDTNPLAWLRLTTHEVLNLGNPIIGLDRYFVFDVFSSEDIYITLSVRENDATAEYGEKGTYAGDFQFVGGSEDDPGPAGLPQKGVLVKAGKWQTVVFDMPNEFVKPGLVAGDDKLDGAKGILESLAIRPVIDENGEWASEHEIFLDNFEVTEVAPPVGDPVAARLRALGRNQDGHFQVRLDGEANTSYVISRRDSLTEGDWEPFAVDDTDGDGVLDVTDTESADAPRRFYQAQPE